MTTPLNGILSVILKSHSSVKISNLWKASQWLFTKSGEFAPGYHRGQLQLVIRAGDWNPGLPHSNPNSDQ